MNLNSDTSPFVSDFARTMTREAGGLVDAILDRPYANDLDMAGEAIVARVTGIAAASLVAGEVLLLGGSERFRVGTIRPSLDCGMVDVDLYSLGHQVDVVSGVDLISLVGALRTTWLDESNPYWPSLDNDEDPHDMYTVTLRGPGRSAFATLSAGRNHSFGLDADGKITAWGDNSFGQRTVPEPNSGFISVSAGEKHSLAVRSDGSVAAWGSNTDAQCTLPSPNSGFISVAAGGVHSLGLKADGTIVTWGGNGSHQCNVPDPNSGFIAVAAGGTHSLGLKADGTVVAWGLNLQGQCTIPSPNAGFTRISAGWRHSLGLKTDGTIGAWGYNDHGECTVPGTNANFSAIAAGWRHSLAVKTDGTLVAWGFNDQGQGVAPSPATGFEAVAAGDGHSLGLKTNGTCVAWGSDSYGQVTVPPTIAGHVFLFVGPITEDIVPAGATIDSAELWINSEEGGAVAWSLHQVLPVTALATLNWLQSASGRPWYVDGCGSPGADYAVVSLNSGDEIPAGASALASGQVLGAILNGTRSVTKVFIARATGGAEAAVYSEMPDNDTLRPYLRLRYSMPRG